MPKTSKGGYFPCSHEGCTKSYAQKSGLNRHVQTEHYGKKYSCSVCSATFTQRTNLKEHENIHNNTGTPAYICHFCPQGFNDKKSCTRHEKQQHGDNSKCTFFCPIRGCEYTFRRLDLMKKHLDVGASKKAGGHGLNPGDYNLNLFWKSKQPEEDLYDKLLGASTVASSSRAAQTTQYSYPCIMKGCFAEFNSLSDAEEHLNNHHEKNSAFHDLERARCPIVSNITSQRTDFYQSQRYSNPIQNSGHEIMTSAPQSAHIQPFQDSAGFKDALNYGDAGTNSLNLWDAQSESQNSNTVNNSTQDNTIETPSQQRYSESSMRLKDNVNTNTNSLNYPHSRIIRTTPVYGDTLPVPGPSTIPLDRQYTLDRSSIYQTPVTYIETSQNLQQSYSSSQQAAIGFEAVASLRNVTTSSASTRQRNFVYVPDNQMQNTEQNLRVDQQPLPMYSQQPTSSYRPEHGYFRGYSQAENGIGNDPTITNFFQQGAGLPDFPYNDNNRIQSVSPFSHSLSPTPPLSFPSSQSHSPSDSADLSRDPNLQGVEPHNLTTQIPVPSTHNNYSKYLNINISPLLPPRLRRF